MKIFKNKELMVLLCLVLRVFIGVGFLLGIGRQSFNRKTDSYLIKNEYEELNDEISPNGKKYPRVFLPENNKIKYVNVDDVYDMFKNRKSMVIYFGYPTCLYCRSAIEVLCDVAKKTDLEVIYYLEIDKDTDYSKILEYLKEELIKENDGKKEITLPLVIFSADGNIVSYWEGTLFSQEDPYQRLNDSQIKGLSEIYEYGIKDVLSGYN